MKGESEEKGEKEDRVGSENVLWRKEYAGFVVRTLGRFPQRTEGWCD